MAINITDGFNLQYSAPIDYRIVASGSVARNAITYKYDGLKVFDRFDRITYVWNSSNSTWTVDNYGVVSGTGTLNYVPKVVGSGLSGLVLGNSVIYATGSFVGINSTVPKGFLQIGSLDDVGTKPFVIHKSGPSAQLGYNWYYDSGDQPFSALSGASRITLGEGYISLETTSPGGSFTSGPGKRTIYAAQGKVGIGRASGPFTLMAEGLIQANTGEGSSINVGGQDLIVGGTFYSDDVHVNIGCLLSGNYGFIQVTADGDYGSGGIGTTPYDLRLQPGGGTVTTGTIATGTMSVSGDYSMIGNDFSVRINGAPAGKEKIKLNATGDFYANIHSGGNSGNGYAGFGTASWEHPSIASGQYLPITSSPVNCGVTSIKQAVWIRVGNVINVSGQFTLTSFGFSPVTLKLSLPVPTSFYTDSSHEDHYWRLNGVGKSKNSDITFIIQGTQSNALVTINDAFASTQEFSYTYQYSADWLDVL